MPAMASLLHATCVPVGEPLVTLRIVSFRLVSVSAVIVPLLAGVNVYHTLLAWPLLAAPVAHPPGSAGSAWPTPPVLAVARIELTPSLNGVDAILVGVALSSLAGAA